MLLLIFSLFTLSLAQDYNCPIYSTSNCASIRKSQKCVEYFQLEWDFVTADWIKLPVRCVDNPASNRYCMATPVYPSTATSGLCRPHCVNNLKTARFEGLSCSSMTSDLCRVAAANCGTNNVKCDWCSYNLTSSTCYTSILCNNGRF